MKGICPKPLKGYISPVDSKGKIQSDKKRAAELVKEFSNGWDGYMQIDDNPPFVPKGRLLESLRKDKLNSDVCRLMPSS